MRFHLITAGGGREVTTETGVAFAYALRAKHNIKNSTKTLESSGSFFDEFQSAFSCTPFVRRFPAFQVTGKRAFMELTRTPA